MKTVITLAAAFAFALALPAAAAIAPDTFTKTDRLDTPALAKSDMLPVNGAVNDNAVIIGYQTSPDAITIFRVPVLNQTTG